MPAKQLLRHWVTGMCVHDQVMMMDLVHEMEDEDEMDDEIIEGMEKVFV